MPDQNTDQVKTGEVIEATPLVSTEKPKRPFYKSCKFIASVFGFIILVSVIVWLVNVFNVYKDAKTYKKDYDKVSAEREYCRRVNAGTEKANVDIFNYCKEFSKRF